MRRFVVCAPVLVFLIVGCQRAVDPADPVAMARAALGQPVGDFPNYDERVTLYATNRARTDPTAEGWPAYPAQPPLQWQVDLNRSARVHSLDMRDTPCFQHNSCDGTDAFARVKTFYTGPWMQLGENISAGKSISDGFIAVHNWIFEIGATPGETGHRDNIFSAKFTLIGNGFAPGGTAFQNYWTQDFVGTTVSHPHLVDGIHFPAAVAAGAGATFGTTYYDAGGAAPTRVAVVVDGACSPLALVHGTAARGAYEAKLPLAAGCHAYFFLATTGGADATYPDTGALQMAVSVAAADCPLAVAARSGNDCGATVDAGAPPDGPSNGSGGATGAGGANASSGGAGGNAAGTGGGGDLGGGGGTSIDGSGGAASGGGGSAGDGSGGAGTDVDGGGVAPLPPPAGGPSVSGSFGCAVAGANVDAFAPTLTALLALGVLFFAHRSRRRR